MSKARIRPYGKYLYECYSVDCFGAVWKGIGATMEEAYENYLTRLNGIRNTARR